MEKLKILNLKNKKKEKKKILKSIFQKWTCPIFKNGIQN